MQQIDDDVSYPRKKSVEACLRSFLTEGFLQNASEKLWDISQVGCIHADGVEGARGYVELISETHIDVRDFALGCGAARPQSERFEKLLRGD